MTKFYTLIILLFTTLYSNAQRQIWGTAGSVGDNNDGIIWQTDSIGDNLSVIHNFNMLSSGSNPGELYLAGNDKLYGTTSSGPGIFDGGVFYEYDLSIDSFKVLKNFNTMDSELPNHIRPHGDGRQSILEVSPGLLYVTLNEGQKVISYNYNTGEFKPLFSLKSFQGGAANSTLQNKFFEGFFKASDGFLYGTTYTNSQCPIPNPNLGSIIRVNPSNNTYTTPFLSPCGADLGVIGFQYNNRFIEQNGTLYSTAIAGGELEGVPANTGVIYSFDLASNKYTKLHNFEGGALGNTPFPMVRANNGKFYGTAYGGESEPNVLYGAGILYQFDPNDNSFEKKYNFKYNNGCVYDVGPFPWNMINGSNGKLYGTTNFGVFEYDPFNNEIRACGGRFIFGQVGTPSLIEICRKPNYKFSEIDLFYSGLSSEFTHDLKCENATIIVWKHNGIINHGQTSKILHFENVKVEDLGVWFAELTNECGTTITQTIELTSDLLSVVDQSYANEIIVYPNPTDRKTMIETNQIIISVKVFDELGKLIVDNGKDKMIDSSKFPQGIYVISICTTKGQYFRRIIKL